METLLILGLAGWIWWQGRRIEALGRRIAALEAQARALAEEREPLLLDTPLAPEHELALARGDAAASAAPPPSAPMSAGAAAAAAALGALYVWFGFALASGAVALSLAILCIASLAGIACAALPALTAPLRLGAAQAIAPALAIAMSSVLSIWVWPLAAQAGFAIAPALAGALHVALASYALRRHWTHGAPFAVAAASLVLGVAGYLRVRAAIAPADVSGYTIALSLAAAIAAAALAARASRRDRALVAFAGAFGAALLLALAAFTRAPWGTPWSWAPLLAGAIAAFAAAAHAAGRTASPEKDWATAWWSSAGCLLALIGAHAISPAALLPVSLAALALTCAYAFRGTGWRALAWAALAACALALLHALSPQTQSAPLGALTAPWAGAFAMAVAAALFQLAARALRSNAPAPADALNAASWAMLVIAALALVTHTQH
jgi:hypothetical protein